jgi:hypothetical protein
VLRSNETELLVESLDHFFQRSGFSDVEVFDIFFCDSHFPTEYLHGLGSAGSSAGFKFEMLPSPNTERNSSVMTGEAPRSGCHPDSAWGVAPRECASEFLRG